MKASTVLTTLVLAVSTLAAPAPRTTMQQQIQNLEVQILTVVNDIVQANPAAFADWNNGLTAFSGLVTELQGPQPCAPFRPGPPTTKEQAITALQNSQAGLMQLSLDLQNPELKIKTGAFHADVCNALDYYSSVSQAVGGN